MHRHLECVVSSFEESAAVVGNIRLVNLEAAPETQTQRETQSLLQ